MNRTNTSAKPKLPAALVKLSSDGTYVPKKVRVLSGFKKYHKVLGVYWYKGALYVDIQERK